jgi:hypothetical protein
VWRPGQVIVRREVWHGRPWSGIPVIVVDDSAEEAAAIRAEAGRLEPELPPGWELG